jgi:hypothetical protein
VIPRCAYLIRWADGGPHPPHLIIGYGAWGEGTTAEDRVSIYAEQKRGGWRFVDHPAPGAPPDEAMVLGAPLAAIHVESDPRSEEVRETLDFIVRNDNRLPF